MRLMIPLCFLGLFAVLAFPLPATAQDAPAAPPAAPGPADGGIPVGKPKAGEDNEAFAILTMAARLADLGRKSGSPLALAAAAELYARISLHERDLPKTAEGGEAPRAEAGPAPVRVIEAAALYAEAAAAARAASDEPLAECIEMFASSSGSSQPNPGSPGHRDRVNPRDTDVYVVRFEQGEEANAAVVADGGYDIDLYIYDDDGRLVTYDNDSASVGTCCWVPDRARDYSVKVRNSTDNYAEYTLLFNMIPWRP